MIKQTKIKIRHTKIRMIQSHAPIFWLIIPDKINQIMVITSVATNGIASISINLKKRKTMGIINVPIKQDDKIIIILLLNNNLILLMI